MPHILSESRKVGYQTKGHKLPLYANLRGVTRLKKWSIYLLLALGLTTGITSQVQAKDPQSAPAELREVLQQIDAAASSRDQAAIAQFYSNSFSTADELDQANLIKSLEQFWSDYDQLQYETQLQSWENDGDALVAETVTRILGTKESDGREIKLESTLRSRQRLVNGQIVQQEILSESTRLLLGENPPQVKVNLPEQVKVGQQFSFDAIVSEPLNGKLLLGGAMEEPISSERYLDPGTFELDMLPAGGIFKVGTAPGQAGNHWVSAILIRTDGITIISQRLRVVD